MRNTRASHTYIKTNLFEKKWWRELDSNQRTLARADLQSAAINHSAIPPRNELADRIKKGFAPQCQVCDDLFMAKPPKRSGHSKNPGPQGNKAGGKGPKNAASGRGEHGNFKGGTASKRGSFRKSEQEKRDKKYVPASVRGRDERHSTPRREDRAPRENRDLREPRGAKIKADLFGFHAVREAWKNPARFVHALYLTENSFKEFESDLKTTAKRPAPTIVTKEELDKAFPPGTVHQGVALACQPLAETSVVDIIIKAEGKPKSVVVMLDQVTDPHNIGAILRSACAFGADGVVMQSKHAPEMTGILAKTACGALEHIPVAYETNLSRALEKLKEHHYTVIGLDEHSPRTFGDLYAYERVVIVLGAEGPGIRRLIREHCDVLVTLPTKPPIASLNVSNAAAVALYALLA